MFQWDCSQRRRRASECRSEFQERTRRKEESTPANQDSTTNRVSESRFWSCDLQHADTFDLRLRTKVEGWFRRHRKRLVVPKIPSVRWWWTSRSLSPQMGHWTRNTKKKLPRVWVWVVPHHFFFCFSYIAHAWAPVSWRGWKHPRKKSKGNFVLSELGRIWKCCVGYSATRTTAQHGLSR